jgi:hypothetical protein
MFDFELAPMWKGPDVCQLRRVVVDLRCKLPGRISVRSRPLMVSSKADAGVSDYGHAQVGITADELLFLRSKFESATKVA